LQTTENLVEGIKEFQKKNRTTLKEINSDEIFFEEAKGTGIIRGTVRFISGGIAKNMSFQFMLKLNYNFWYISSMSFGEPLIET
jgi:hypothetical protein